MDDTAAPAVAIVGIGAVMPDAPDAATFWNNIKSGHYAISEVSPDRWDPALFYDPDPAAPDKTYSKIGGWVRDFTWEPMRWKLPIPPKVSEQMDVGQQWSIACSRAALLDAGWPDWPVDPERVAVIFGNAIGGEKHYETTVRVMFPQFARELRGSPSFAALPESIRESVIAETHKAYTSLSPEITEDTMPGELSNVLAGRVCNLFNFRGPNFTTDAACASGLAAMNAAVGGLLDHQYDVALSGGIDRNNAVNGFIKFCKIGALSATGTRPFDAGADGFVMGEGAAIYVLKRLADAERDGDHIYALLLALGGSSDGKGKGITAPNPVGQRLAVERAWRRSGLDPAAAGLMEAHGTSTRVGDLHEAEALQSVFGPAGAAPGSIPLGSVKSNIGHLKAAAGAAGMFKAVMALHEKVLPPSLHFRDPNPNIDWASSPFAVNTELRDFPAGASGARSAGVSAFGFGGTNFHAVLEEYVPGRHRPNGQRSFAGADIPQANSAGNPGTAASASAATANPGGPAAAKAPLRGALVVGAPNERELADRLQGVVEAAGSLGGTAAGGAGSCRPGRARARRDRLRRCRRTRRQGGAGPEGPEVGAAGCLEDAALARRVPGPRPGAEGRVPVHGPGFPVREHAQDPARHRADRGGHLRRGRSGHEAAARPASHRLHLHRRRRPGCGRPARAAAAPDRDHPAGRPRHRRGVDPPARRLRHPAGHGHGTQPRRVRRPRGGRLADLPGGPGGGQRPRAGDGEPEHGRQRRDGGGDGAAARDRAHRRGGGRLRRHRQRQQQQAGCDRRRDRRRGKGRRAAQGGGPDGHPAAGQPRVPHEDRGARQQTAAGRAAAAARGAAVNAAGGQRRRPVLPDRTRRG